MKIYFTLTAMVLSSICFGQQDSLMINRPDSNSVIIHKDARLELLVKKQAYINEVTTREGRKTDKGYRLMVISTNNRDEAMKAKTIIYSNFPELKAYLWYQSPYFRVKAGNFLDKEDAENYQRKLNRYFPKGVFVMKDIIEVKPAKNIADDDIQP